MSYSQLPASCQHRFVVHPFSPAGVVGAIPGVDADKPETFEYIPDMCIRWGNLVEIDCWLCISIAKKKWNIAFLPPIDAKRKNQSETGKLDDDDGPTYLMMFLVFYSKFFPVENCRRRFFRCRINCMKLDEAGQKARSSALALPPLGMLMQCFDVSVSP